MNEHILDLVDLVNSVMLFPCFGTHLFYLFFLVAPFADGWLVEYFKAFC